jgi:hypothetical protein
VRRQIPTQCPVCGEGLHVTRLGCEACQTAIEGKFDSGRLARLTRDQLAFVEVFLECRGKIKDVEERLGLSYPTVVARLEQVVESLGAPTQTEPTTSLEEVLTSLAKKEISPSEAAKKIKQGRKNP